MVKRSFEGKTSRPKNKDEGFLFAFARGRGFRSRGQRCGSIGLHERGELRNRPLSTYGRRKVHNCVILHRCTIDLYSPAIDLRKPTVRTRHVREMSSKYGTIVYDRRQWWANNYPHRAYVDRLITANCSLA